MVLGWDYVICGADFLVLLPRSCVVRHFSLIRLVTCDGMKYGLVDIWQTASVFDVQRRSS